MGETQAAEARVDPTRLDNQTVIDARTRAEALGDLYDRFHGPIYRYCFHRLCTRAAAEDVTSCIFLKVARRIRGFRGRSVGQFSGWLYRIATNEIRAYLRDQQRKRRVLEAVGRFRAVGRTATYQPDSPPLEWPEVQRHLLRLSPTDQALIALRYFEDMSTVRIAEILDRSPEATRTALSRALKRLRRRAVSRIADAGRR
jgi:RNA polymerase sigma-70 factor (ECF subfamily)